MAINFLNTVAFNQNSLEKPRIENQPNDTAAGTGVVGQLYFNTTSDTLKQYVSDTGGGAAGWVEVGATSGVETLTINAGTYIAPNSSGTAAKPVFAPDLSAVDGTSTAADRFLTKANKWATIPFGDITEVQGGTYINVTNQTGPVPIVNHDTTSRSNTTSTAAPAYGASFTAIDTVTTNTTGHVTATNLKTITLPADTNETYTLPVAAGASNSAIINLTAGGTGSGVKSSVTFLGTTGRIAITETVGNNGNITVDLTDNVTIIGDATIGGDIDLTGQIDMNGSKIVSLGNGTLSSDAVNLGQVEALVAGIGLFKGGYNATSGLTVNLGAGNGSLDGASNIALDQGDFFVVTVAGGAFYTETLEVGDMIYANVAIAANSNPAISKYTVVIQDANIAGADATDGATAKGVAGFDSASFNVTASGWVQLDAQRNPYGATQTLDNTSPSARVESGGLTTFTINLADASLFGAGALAKNITVEVTQNVSPYQTVYADVTRSGSASMSIVFSGSVAVDIYRVLLTHI